ncbi:MAG: 6-bladed beta-propeller [Chloroflexota bacterium]
MSASRMGRALLALMFAGVMLAAALSAGAVAPANEAFDRTWGYTDFPVASGEVSRTWMWGPEAFTDALDEPYEEAPDGERTVQYFDKSRMEITNPDGDQDSIWYVTNGLLVLELVTGRMQIGNSEFEDREPADINVAGDINDPNGPTYETVSALLDEPATEPETVIVQEASRDGEVSENNDYLQYGVIAEERVQVPGIDHTIAAPFWDFMNSSGIVWSDETFVEDLLFPNAFYATGLPISEAYWTTINVAGEPQDVLFQAFERRVLTYTPSNDPGWRVEAGNVGQHYYSWRYDTTVPDPDEPDEPDEPDPTPEPDPTEPPEPSPAPSEGEVFQLSGEFGTLGDGDGEMMNPRGVAVFGSELVYVADTENDRVSAYAQDGDEFLFDFGSSGSGVGQFDHPVDVAVNSQGRIYVLDSGNHRVQMFDDEGDYLGQWGGFGSDEGEFNNPMSLAIDTNDDVLVLDTGNHRVQKFDSLGNFILEWGEFGNGDFDFNNPMAIALDRGSNVYIADTGNDRVKHFTSEGFTLLNQWSSAGDGALELDAPQGVGIDNLGNVIVSDTGNDRIVVVTRDGEDIVDSWGDSDSFNNPTSLAVSDQFELFVADTDNHRIIRYQEE